MVEPVNNPTKPKLLLGWLATDKADVTDDLFVKQSLVN
ncbi:hypothetical protein CAL7102_08469 [Dulcicalothrix desertica PCC 7102]|nr:hypothetical protein CAL7102_08469 [Dulcicalothrix desertica PCC 7102]